MPINASRKRDLVELMKEVSRVELSGCKEMCFRRLRISFVRMCFFSLRLTTEM